jgi:potassium/hydrogen antiporter
VTTANTLLLLGGLLLFLSVLGSTLSARLGFPLLLIFLILGMLAGVDGPIGIEFDNFDAAFLIGNLALAIILLDGGLGTRISTFRVALWPAATLATWGVIVTVGLLGVFVTWLLDVDWRYGLLLAAIVGSTDAAAVFNVLRHSGVRLNERVGSTLEIESGTNDPMAIFLVIMLIELLMNDGETSVPYMLLMLVQQLGVGAAAGLLGGWALARMVSRLHLPEGLYALMIASGGLTIFAATNHVGGSGFLAIYLAGLVVGNQRSQATEHVMRVTDGLAWLAQAGMFLILGMLVTPTQILDSAGYALAIAFFLILVARPLAVLSCLAPFRFPPREIGYVSWVGLRGAVPIVLAMFPVIAGVPESQLLFEVTFAVVLVSLLIQGTTVPAMARLLRLVIPHRAEPRDQKEIWISRDAMLELVAFRVEPYSQAIGRPLSTLCGLDGRPIQCVVLIRNGERIMPADGVEMEVRDEIWLLAEPEDVEHLAAFFSQQDQQGQLASRNFFGEFTLNPDSPAADLARAYGLELADQELKGSIGGLVTRRLGRRPVVGDRVTIGTLRLAVRKIDAGRITQIGLKLTGF